MGGKNKGANRTKNNARPSNSGRSVAMLNASVPQFAGLSGIKEASGFPTFALNTVEEFDSSIDGSFQLVLKKISKKDSTTKLKGLQEFADLIKSAEPDVVKAVLPVWPRFFNVLATDANGRVREATHNVHHQIVTKVKRNIAPYLKQLMPPWFTSQYDNYPPAASAAVKAFKDTFSNEKFQEAIIFCQEEILNYINDNLLIQTAETISGKQATREETEAKYERVLIACLQGYALYLERVPSEKIKEFMVANSHIVSNTKFWKLSKHPVPQVRSAWFQLLSVIFQKSFFLLENKEAQVLTTIFDNLEEAEPLVLPNVWECLLLSTSLIKEWSIYVNVEKLFLPKFQKVLKQAGQGNASIIYPSLLPLIAHLSNIFQENKSVFYKSFFEGIRAGLTLKTVASSKSESVAVVEAFIECLRYVVTKNISDTALCNSLIKSHLLSTLEWYFTDDSSSYKTFFSQTAGFVQGLAQSDSTKPLLNFFFEALKDLFNLLLSTLPKDGKNKEILISCKQIEFLHCLKQTHKKKRYSKVKFTTEHSDHNSINLKPKETLDNNDIYLEALNTIVVSVCLDYVTFIQENHTKCLLEQLCSLITDFDGKMLFSSLLNKMKQNQGDANFVDIYNEILKKWLHSDILFSKGVVKMIFLLFTYLDPNERDFILKDLVDIGKSDCLAWAISEALSYPYIEDKIVRSWLGHKDVGKFFIDIVEKQIANECPSELEILLKLALTENQEGEFFVTKNVLKEIINKLSLNLLNNPETSITLESCSTLASYICSIIYTESLLLTYGDELLLTLFEVSCKVTQNEDISSETLWELNSSWQDAVTLLFGHLSKEDRNILTEKFTSILEKQFLSFQIITYQQVEHLTNIIVSFLKAAYQTVPLAISSLVDILFNRSWSHQNINITTFCKVASYVTGDLRSPTNEITIEHALSKIEILQYFAWSYIKSVVLFSRLNSDDITEENEEFFKEDPNYSDPKVSPLMLMDKPEEALLDILYDCTIGEEFLMFFTNIKYYNEIFDYYVLLEQKLKTSMCDVKEDMLIQIKSLLKVKCLEFGWFWCKTAYLFFIKLLKQENVSVIYNELSDNSYDKNKISLLHLRQVFATNSNDNQVDLEQEMADVFEQIENLRNENMAIFYYETENISWEKTEKIIEAVRLTTKLVNKAVLTRRYWDFAVLSLVSWTSNCFRVRKLIKNIQFQSLVIAVANLYMEISQRINAFEEQKIEINYVNEWNDVLVESIHADLAQLWLYISEKLSEENIVNLPLLQYFGRFTESIRYKFIFKPSENFPKWTKFLKRSCSLLTNEQAVLQIWGYRMLRALVPGLIEIDNNAVNTNTPHHKGLIFEQFKEKLIEVQDVVNSMLMEFKIGESTCNVKPSFESFTYTLAYLLLWDVMLNLCQNSSSEVLYQYADWLRKGDLFKYFLENLLRLMPEEVVSYNEGKSKVYSEYFLKEPFNQTCYIKSYDSITIQRMVCYLYKSSLAYLPALVRQWWTSLDSKVSQVVDKITTAFVSPYLCTEELNEITQHQSKFKNLTVKVLPTVREIIAVYTVDEAQMELSINLPSNYPLGGLEVQCNKQICGTTHKQWLLQLKKCVLHQNGRIWDGLSLWNNNLDRKFDGVEECYICYAVLHPGTYQLPRLSCQTCKKKFHSACLYKWFSTSNKSSCPICRNLF